ncbi:MAG TPA: MqnA/MqnD/SBP family protein [Thermoanaerobaculia bacterium]|nr:MqnA/MqnD/SBP family protein [Thermoanaerobaculia bacterium]
MSETTLIRIAHSPDSDDAFMFYALTQGLLDTSGLAIEHQLADIETLNQAAFEGRFEITALSFHAYAYLADRYRLMPSGASFGDGYGPVVVARQGFDRAGLAGRRVAIPGRLTTAALVLRLWQPQVETAVVPFDQILPAVASGEFEAGVVIHEGQLTFEEHGLRSVVDLGAWWKEETGGPLPLGGNGIRRDLPEELQQRLCRLLTQSIDYALSHRSEALSYAIRYARDLEDDPVRSDRFVGMYVNEWTQRYGEAGRRAVQLLLDRAAEAGILPNPVVAEFVEV